MSYGVETNNQKALSYLENSILKDLLSNPDITDISFNGNELYYLDNFKGRQKADLIFTNEMAKDFLRQIANLAEQQFSYSMPILDVSIGRYRINAVHQSIGRYQNEKRFTFAIRIGSLERRINKDSNFLTNKLVVLFNTLLSNNVSIIIGGSTGSGKTEFQKYLISNLAENTRIIVVDNVLELDILRDEKHLDLNIWQADENSNSINVQKLVRNALRSNPDWLIVSEARGGEMLEVLNSVMTGHPIITTIHALDVKSIPNRVVRMIMMNDKKQEYKDVMRDFTHHIKVGVFLKRKIDDNGIVHRFIEDIVEFEDIGKINYLYSYKDGVVTYGKISESLYKLLDKDKLSNEFKNMFIKGDGD